MRIAAVAGLLALSASCVHSPPRKAVETDLAVPPRWSAETADSRPIGDAWWSDLGNEQLTALIGEAWRRSPDLHLALARLDAAAAEARIAGAELWPGLEADLDAARRQQNFIGLPIPGSSAGVLTSRSTSYGVSLNTFWELDLWGRIRSGKRAARAELEANEEELRGAYLSLAAQTAKAWLAAAEAEQQVELAGQTARNYDETAEKVRSRYERGLRSPLDVRLALSSLSNAEALLRERRLQRARAVRQLEILAGRYPAGDLGVSAEFPELSAGVPAGLPSELLLRRPDLAAAERRFASSQARVKEARAALFPRLSLTAGGGTSTSELEDLVSSDFTVWSWAVNLAQPIFQGGRLRAGVDLAKARSRQAAAQYAGELLRAFAEVETALAGEQWLREREEQVRDAATQATAAQGLAEDRYASGLEDFVTVLEAQRRALEAESELIRVRRARLDNRVDLHLALGGGFQTNQASGTGLAPVPRKRQSSGMSGSSPRIAVPRPGQAGRLSRLHEQTP